MKKRINSTLNIVTFAALALALPDLASALGSVPLIPLGTDVDNINDAGAMKLSGAGLGPLLPSHRRDGKALVFADPAQLEYPMVLSSVATTAASTPDIQINDPTLDNIQILPKYSQDPYP